MNVEKDKTTAIILAIGAGLLGGFLFPSVNGPLDIFKTLRAFGKPFTCALCSGFWSTVIFVLLLPIMPFIIAIAIGSAGWVLLIHHAGGYNVIYEGME